MTTKQSVTESLMAKFFPQKAMNGESSRLKVSYLIEEGLNHARVQFRNY